MINNWFRIFVLVISLYAFSNTSYGQEGEFYKRYLFNQLTTNPSLAGSTGQYRLSLVTRDQWSSFKGSPNTDRIAFDMPLGKAEVQKLGVGVHLISDKAGPEETLGMYASFAYRTEVGQGMFSAGINAGYISYKYNVNGFQLFEEDPIAFSTQTTGTHNINIGFNKWLLLLLENVWDKL